jgi:hypothetical protein
VWLLTFTFWRERKARRSRAAQAREEARFVEAGL